MSGLIWSGESEAILERARVQNGQCAADRASSVLSEQSGAREWTRERFS